MNYWIVIFIFIIILIVTIFVRRGGADSFVKREISLLVDDLEKQYGKAVLKHLNTQFDEDFNNTTSAIGQIITKYDIESVEDFIRLAGLAQYNFLTAAQLSVLNTATHYMPNHNDIKQLLKRMLNKCLPATADAIDAANYLSTAHKFYKLSDLALKMTKTKLVQLAKKSPQDVFEPDELAYRPIVTDYCAIARAKSGKDNTGNKDIVELLKDLYYLDPKLYKYGEISKIYTVKDLTDYLRRKLLGYTIHEIDERNALEQKLQETEKENTKLKLREAETKRENDKLKNDKIETKRADDYIDSQYDIDLQRALKESLKDQGKNKNIYIDESAMPESSRSNYYDPDKGKEEKEEYDEEDEKKKKDEEYKREEEYERDESEKRRQIDEDYIKACEMQKEEEEYNPDLMSVSALQEASDVINDNEFEPYDPSKFEGGDSSQPILLF